MQRGRTVGGPRGTSRPPRRAADLRDLPTIQDERVLLRAWQIGDLALIAEAAEDPYIPSIASIPTPYTTSGGSGWLRRQWTQAAERRGASFVITERASGEAVGMAVLNSIDWSNRRASVGYWLVARRRGRGLAGAAVELLVRLAGELGLVRVEALVEVGNERSQAVCRAAGFEREGLLRSYLRIGDRNRDMVVFSRLLLANQVASRPSRL